jgi:hypothetical protein
MYIIAIFFVYKKTNYVDLCGKQDLNKKLGLAMLYLMEVPRTTSEREQVARRDFDKLDNRVTRLGEISTSGQF